MSVAWLNGSMTKATAARLPLNDRGFLLADGLFETMLAVGGQIHQRDAHLERLQAGLERLGIELPYNRAMLEDALTELLAVNAVSLSPGSGRGALRLTVSRGVGPRGIAPPANVEPTVLITVTPAPKPSMTPMTMFISSIWRNESSPSARLKTLMYLDNVMAQKEARDAGFDDAVMLNSRKRVACSTVGNLFVVKGNQLLTPALSEGVLAGITRAELLDLAPSVGLEAVETSLTEVKLLGADEAFFTNSLAGVRAISRVNDVVLGDGKETVGPVTAALQEAYEARLPT